MKSTPEIIVAAVVGSACCLLFIGGIFHCIRTRNNAIVTRENRLDHIRHDRV